ncbi:hypothetical protein PE36_08131 [Moritella sp. PE36]|uniref:DUF4238 domain-containing protein n=1 Tax=Moritella sp. PE36 TaxID=58051 RepID=UPI0001568EF0|nr:DUF4238 domain-containing protein [Moritella sp. PE36]EDM65954.1 hypothetical protein PE36_08131 [Moritella sp. PE36]
MKNRKIKKNQHYVPKSHLKRFTIDGEKSLIWAFDKIKGEYERLTSSINKICAEDYYYYQIDPNGDVDHTLLEDVLSEIEMVGNNLIDKILGSRSLHYVPINGAQKGELAFYIALLMFRGPSFRDGIAEIYGQIARQTLNKVWDNAKVPKPLQELVEKEGLSNVIDLQINSTVSLEHMAKSAQAAALEFLKKEWVLINAPEGSNFVTGDVPVVFSPYHQSVGDVGPAHPLAEILYPISKDTALILTPSNDPKEYILVGEYNDALLHEINTKISGAATKYVYSSEKFNWLVSSSRTLGNGQRLVSNVASQGISIVKNPWKRKTNKQKQVDA